MKNYLSLFWLRKWNKIHGKTGFLKYLKIKSDSTVFEIWNCEKKTTTHHFSFEKSYAENKVLLQPSKENFKLEIVDVVELKYIKVNIDNNLGISIGHELEANRKTHKAFIGKLTASASQERTLQTVFDWYLVASVNWRNSIFLKIKKLFQIERLQIFSRKPIKELIQ